MDTHTLNNFTLVCKEVFGEIEFEEEAIFKGLIYNYEEVLSHKRSLKADTTVFSTRKRDKIMSLDAMMREGKDTDFMLEKKEVSSIKEINELMKEVNFYLGEKYVESKDCIESDDIYSSVNIYRSSNITDCKEIGYSDSLFNSAYMYFCSHSTESSFSIGSIDSKLLSNCYKLDWCGKCSDSMCCYDSFDLRDCMFCFHLKSRRYCIGNMQFGEAEYRRIRKVLVHEILHDLVSVGGK